ncbi:uncharacterized protein LOC126569269 [Anopheles aquasalis]|uniref:uncharacterized protein LOC126569269 n=1 Tax=Anopheles aquasalis TaxID=42839 RepID=UPI00215B0DD3|nr:uncharacterized protein LOC126569269 [Anopheles aquasalis]
MAQSMHFARVSIKVQGVALCLLLACVLQNAVVHSSENAPSTPEEVQDGVMESAEPLVETKPIEMEGLGLEARMALPDREQKNKKAANVQLIGSVINKDGGLDPVYQTVPPPLPHEELQFANSKTTEPIVKDQILTKKITDALEKGGTRYKEVLANNITRHPVDYDDTTTENVTKAFMCRSTVTHKYPTAYMDQNKLIKHIVNVKGFYQGITYDECDEHEAVCNEGCSSLTGEYRCVQLYAERNVVVAQVEGKGEKVTLSLEKISYESGCKCRRMDLLTEN